MTRQRTTTSSTISTANDATKSAGLDTIAQGSIRHAGFIPSRKTAAGGHNLVMYSSLPEQWLALWLELNPDVKSIYRGDLSQDAAKVRGVVAFDPTPYVIPVRDDEGKAHEYWPDFVGYLADGHLYGAEAGTLAKKSEPLAIQKITTAIEHFREGHGGQYFLSLGEEQAQVWFGNALTLHLARFGYRGPDSLLGVLKSAWMDRSCSVVDLVAAHVAWIDPRTGAAVDPTTLQQAALKVAGDALAEGRFDLNLERDHFDLYSKARITVATAPLRALPAVRDAAPEVGEKTEVDEVDPMLPKALVNLEGLSAIAMAQARAKLDGITAVINGKAKGKAFESAGGQMKMGITLRRFQQLADEFNDHGEVVVVPHLRYQRARTNINPDILPTIKRLHVKGLGPTDIAESYQVRDATAKAEPTINRKTGLPEKALTPSVDQVAHYQRTLRQMARVNDDRSTRSRIPLATGTGRIHHLPWRPGYLCEVDETYLDVVVSLHGLIPALDSNKKPKTSRVWLQALRCATTRCILAVTVSPKRMDVQDYRRLLLRAVQPKDALTRRAGSKNDWPCTVVPTILRSDRAWIYVKAKLARQAAEDFAFVHDLGPIKQPETHAGIESFWNGFEKTLLHPLEIAVGNDLASRARGINPQREAVGRRVTLVELENAIVRHITDTYHVERNRGLRIEPIEAWKQGTAAFGARQYMALDADEPRRKLTLQLPNPPLVINKGISFLGHWYGDRWPREATGPDPRLVRKVGRDKLTDVLKDRQGTRINIKVLDDDLRTVDAYDLDGQFIGVLVSNQMAAYGRPVSRTEIWLEQRAERDRAAKTHPGAVASRQDNQSTLEGSDPRRAAAYRQHTVERAMENDGLDTSDVPDIAKRQPPLTAPSPVRVAAPAPIDDTDYPEPPADPIGVAV